jgi:hypothetical protein
LKQAHYVPYFATIVWSFPVVLTVGVLFGVLLVPQMVATVVLHVLMARHHKKNIDDQLTLLSFSGSEVFRATAHVL